MNVLQPYSNVIREVFKSTCGRFYDYSLDFAISHKNFNFLSFYEPQPVKRCIKNTPLFWLEGKIYLLCKIIRNLDISRFLNVQK